MMTSTISIVEKKNKKKGMRVTVLFHLIIVALALYPFLGPSQEDDIKLDNPILISFTDFDSASKKSAKGTTNKKDKPAKKNTPETKPTEKVEVKPVVVPEPERKPIVTAPNKEVTVKEEVKKVESKVKEVPKPEPVKEVKVEVNTKKPVKETANDKPVEVAKNTRKPSKSKAEAAEGDSDGEGGSADAGKDVGEGNAGEGDAGMDFSGDGIFGRRVVYRADIKKLTKKRGIIVINLCVNREGRVVYATYNPDASTITDKSLIRDTELTVAKYRFDKDYTADAKQCGKLTINFDID